MPTSSEATYDLGDLDFDEARSAVSDGAAARPRSAPVHPTRPAMRAPAARPGPRHHAGSSAVEIPGSLSLFVPGSGQILRGDVARGMLILSFCGLIAALAWATMGSLDRMAITLDLLGYPAAAAAWLLGVLYVAGCALHLGNVVHANGPGAHCGGRPHPIVSAAASIVVPGWGQILNGDRMRAALFVALLWVAGAGWILVSPPAGRVLAELNLYLPPWLDVLTTPVVRWTVPAIVWTLAVYDAAHRAMSRH